jgi:hypothetical protein
MNKAVEELKKTLGELFETVYDAFSFFDIDGGSSPEKSANSPLFLHPFQRFRFALPSCIGQSIALFYASSML